MSSKVKVKGQGHKVKKCKILIFSLVQENEVKGQGYGVKFKGHEAKVKCLIFNLVLRSVITVRCGKREVRQRWGVFITYVRKYM